MLDNQIIQLNQFPRQLLWILMPIQLMISIPIYWILIQELTRQCLYLLHDGDELLNNFVL